MKTWTIFRRLALGFLAGAVISAAIGTSHLVALGLTMGVQIGIDGTVQSAVSPISPWSVGLAVLATSGLLYSARDAWWVPRAARVAALLTVGCATCIGIAIFDLDYMMTFGLNPLWIAIPVEMSRSVASYAFLGIGLASLLVSRNESKGVIEQPRVTS